MFTKHRWKVKANWPRVTPSRRRCGGGFIFSSLLLGLWPNPAFLRSRSKWERWSNRNRAVSVGLLSYSCSPIPDGRAGLARGTLLYFTLVYFGLLARPEIDFWHFQKSICGLTINFGISSRNWLLACPKNNLWPHNSFWYFVQKLTFGMSKNQCVASQLIWVFRPEIDFWHVQKTSCGLKLD